MSVGWWSLVVRDSFFFDHNTARLVIIIGTSVSVPIVATLFAYECTGPFAARLILTVMPCPAAMMAHCDGFRMEMEMMTPTKPDSKKE